MSLNPQLFRKSNTVFDVLKNSFITVVKQNRETKHEQYDKFVDNLHGIRYVSSHTAKLSFYRLYRIS